MTMPDNAAGSGSVSINWRPDKTDKLPVYRQIVNYISSKISRGDWIIGGRIPPQRELSQLFGVNRSTIVQALEELKAQGLIEGNFGQGTRIVNNTWSLLVSAPPPNWRKYITASIYKSNLSAIQVINKQEFAPGIIRLSTGEIAPELFPHAMMKKILRRIPEKVHSLNYLEPLGLLELRKIISAYLEQFDIRIPPSCLLITSGSLQALQLISIGMLQPGSTVFTEIPSYLKSLHVFQSSGMHLAGIPMDSRGLIPWRLDRQKAAGPTALLYTIPTFHNPTGRLMPEERRAELIEWCKNNRLPIIEDDVYRELWIDGPPPAPLKARDKNGIVLYLGSASKSLAPGLRIGWLAGPEPVVERLADVKMQVDYGASSLSQWALAEWIDSGLYAEHLLSLRKNLKNRRDLVLGILEKRYKEIASWNIPTGGYYIWLQLAKDLSTEKLFHKALKEKILIHPGSLYDFSKNSHIRLSYSYASPEALEKGLDKLADLIQAM